MKQEYLRPGFEDAADYIEQLEREVARLKRENAELLHDLERQMTIANTECNEAEELRAALHKKDEADDGTG